MSYDLNRFIKAQSTDFSRALSEIRAGYKQSHWMWYIFPQLKALGYSDTAKYYGIEDLAEAQAYMAEPSLRNHLITITEALLALDTSDPHAVMGSPDDLKLCSSMTLFEIAAPDVGVFSAVIGKYYHGKRDEKTLALLKKEQH